MRTALIGPKLPFVTVVANDRFLPLATRVFSWSVIHMWQTHPPLCRVLDNLAPNGEW